EADVPLAGGHAGVDRLHVGELDVHLGAVVLEDGLPQVGGGDALLPAVERGDGDGLTRQNAVAVGGLTTTATVRGARGHRQDRGGEPGDETGRLPQVRFRHLNPSPGVRGTGTPVPIFTFAVGLNSHSSLWKACRIVTLSASSVRPGTARRWRR